MKNHENKMETGLVQVEQVYGTVLSDFRPKVVLIVSLMHDLRAGFSVEGLGWWP